MSDLNYHLFFSLIERQLCSITYRLNTQHQRAVRQHTKNQMQHREVQQKLMANSRLKIGLIWHGEMGEIHDRKRCRQVFTRFNITMRWWLPFFNLTIWGWVMCNAKPIQLWGADPANPRRGTQILAATESCHSIAIEAVVLGYWYND